MPLEHGLIRAGHAEQGHRGRFLQTQVLRDSCTRHLDHLVQEVPFFLLQRSWRGE